jgi:hypothetical protein
MTLPARLSGVLLVLLAIVLPFEVLLFRLGPLGITSVEIVMYATLTAFGLHVTSEWVRGRASVANLFREWRSDPLCLASALWVATVFASAVAAPSYRTASVKFALRTLCGVLIFFATRSLGRAPYVARRVLFALIASALVSAATALLESSYPAIASLFEPFRAGSFGAFGLRRASGVFAYPTIGAVYWEAALSLLVVAPFVHTSPERPVRRYARPLAIAGVAVLAAAILASATRSGLAGGVIACAALLLLTRTWGGWLPRTAAGSLVVFVVTPVIVVALSGPDSRLGQRLLFWQDDDWFGVKYEVPPARRQVASGEVFTTPIRLRNTGALTWRQGGSHPTSLGHHWYVEPLGEGAILLEAFDPARAELPGDVPPGGVVDVLGVARAPDTEGRYLLAWDLVQEHVTWFSAHGNGTAEELVAVGGAVVADDVTPWTDGARRPGEPPPPARSALWRAAITLWRESPLLGVGPDNFRRRYERVLSPAANGSPYTDTRIHANSLYFETLADVGLVGVLALALLSLAWLRALRAHASMKRVAGLGFSVAAGVFFVHGVSDYFLEFTPTYGLFWMLLGLTAASGKTAAPGENGVA